MKTLQSAGKISFTVLLFLLPALLIAQSPKLVSYQAIVRDASNNPKVNTEVSLIMTINQGSQGGTQVYSETHTVTTNDYGLVNVMLGDGSNPVGDFTVIDWSNSPYYLNINIDGNDMDPVQLVSVPYAIYADKAGNVFSGDYNDLSNKPVLNLSNWNTAYSWGDHSTRGYYDSKWEQSGNDVYVPEDMQVGIGTSNPLNNMLLVAASKEMAADDPVFQVVNTDGIPVFTIFNDGSVDVQLLDDQTAKGPKGGFAIGGFDPTKGELTTMPFMSIGPDSTRFYFNETEIKGPKGGFAIGGFDRSKGINDKYVEVRGARGLAGNNIFMGYQAGGEFGYASSNNIAIGYNAGLNLQEGTENNVLIGNTTGDMVRGSNNIFIGNGAGTKIESGDYQLLIDAVPQEDPSMAYIAGNMDDKSLRTLRLNANTGIKRDAEPGADLAVAGSIIAEAFNQKSDMRFKTDIKPITNSLNKVLSLRGVTFNWKRDGKPSDDKSLGLIAQEAVEIIPELVSKGTDYYSINYAPLTALLIEAVKELKKENDEMKAELSKVEDLERQIQELREKMNNF
ncbi:MAG: tail fiber domain-containing protein [Bacteroidales bacterium]